MQIINVNFPGLISLWFRVNKNCLFDKGKKLVWLTAFKRNPPLLWWNTFDSIRLQRYWHVCPIQSSKDRLREEHIGAWLWFTINIELQRKERTVNVQISWRYEICLMTNQMGASNGLHLCTHKKKNPFRSWINLVEN